MAILTERKRRKVKKALEGYLFASPWLVGFGVLTIYPMISSLYYSFSSYDIFSSPVFIGLENYREILFFDERFWISLYNTLYYTIFAVPLQVGLALLIAILLNQKVPFTRTFRTIYYLPTMLSGVALAVVWRWIFNGQYGLLNHLLSFIGVTGPQWLADEAWAKPALILMSLWGIGGGIVIYLAGLQGIPSQLYEAARIDGANNWHTFRHIMVPLMTPVIFFNLIMGMIGAFQVFDHAFVMTGGGPVDSTLFYVLYIYNTAFKLYKMGYASALAWILFIIVVAFTILNFSLSNRWVFYGDSDD